MRVNTLILDQSSFGTTSKSLKMLRNAVADNLHDEILVLEIPTSDICSGFLLLNKTAKSATWSGDGFRHDKGGEGGRGYAAAHTMMDTFGIKYFKVYSPDAIQAVQNALAIRSSEIEMNKAMLNACNKIAEEFEDSKFKCMYETNPWY